jgi:predicted secreted protein
VDIVSGFLVYLCLWVVLFFMLLPVGVQRIEKPDAGWDAGAPQKPLMGKKLLWTTLISIPLWGVAYYLLVYVAKWGSYPG